ncbi:TPA: hypothetical protein ACSPZ8_000516 [Aeromonas hydrophila]
MKKNMIPVALVSAVLSCQVQAVDGYKNVKFGASTKEVMESGLCSFSPVDYGIKGVTSLECDDLPFGGDKVSAAAFFIGDKFLRFAVESDVEKAVGLRDSLIKKYGKPSSMSPAQYFTAIDTTPNTEAFIAFDRDTVFMKLENDEQMKQSVTLLYTDKSYEKLLSSDESSALSEDL